MIFVLSLEEYMEYMEYMVQPLHFHFYSAGPDICGHNCSKYFHLFFVIVVITLLPLKFAPFIFPPLESNLLPLIFAYQILTNCKN